MKRQKERGLRGWVSNAVAAGLFSLVVACGGGAQSAPEVAVPNDPPRVDLSYAYYGNEPVKQLAETSRHVTHHFVAHWYGPGVTMEEAKAAHNAGLKIILALDTPYAAPLQEGVLRATFNSLRAVGALGSVAIIYPQDEPELHGYSDATVLIGNATIRKVMAEFPELAGTKLAVIYTSSLTLPGLASFDLAGFDDYDKGASIFTNGAYNAFKSRLRADQGIILVPGGADKWRQDPAQFILKAQNDKQVKLVMPFLWFDNADPANGARGPGIRSNGLAPAYCAWGMRIRYPGITMPC